MYNDFYFSDKSQRSFIVYEEQLLSLFKHCPRCHLPVSVKEKTVIGTFVRVQQSCQYCFYQHKWDSQPFVREIPLGNLILSSSILFSGAVPEQALRIFSYMHCATITSRAYYSHQQSFLLPAIHSTWSGYQFNLLQQLQALGKPLMIGGDGRADSPGHSAKYGSYTLMELEHKAILDVQLVQVI